MLNLLKERIDSGIKGQKEQDKADARLLQGPSTPIVQRRQTRLDGLLADFRECRA